MEKKTKTELATNLSSGAEKVEKIEKQTLYEETPNAQEYAIDGGRVEMKKEKEEKAAKSRVAAAKQKKQKSEKKAQEKKSLKTRLAERKEQAAKRLAERKAKAEKRAAERKAKAEKRLAERKAKAEKRAAAREAMIRERAHKKANRTQERNRENARRKQSREHKNRNGKERQSYGGWLAAVIALGAITLGLTTALTVGAIEMNKTNDSIMGGYKSTAYELMGIMEHVDDDLDRIRVSASPVQQERILTDLLVQARLAALDLEKMPVDGQADANLTAFVNRVGKMSEALLTKLRLGGSLNEKDVEMLESLYQTSRGAKEQVSQLSTELDDTMIMEYIKKGEGKIKEILNSLEELTLGENGKMPQEQNPQKDGAGMSRKAIPDANGEQKQGQNAEQGAVKTNPAQAEEACKEYFKSYKIQSFQCVGETVNKGYTAYNLQGYDDKGTLLLAEIDVESGALVRFDYYEPCENVRFDMENAQRQAEQFLSGLGYENMSAARVRENGTDADFTFVYKMDDVRVDPDEVKVKICRDRGIVTAFDASRYLKNHKERTAQQPKLSMQDVKDKLHKNLTFEQGELALVQAKGGERLAYELLCSYGEEKYFVYVDANTGNEIAILNAKNR